MSEKQKILIVHNYYQIPGGEDTVVANEKKLLEENGHEVILYSRSNSELKSFSKLQKLELPFSTIFNIKTFSDIKRIIREENIDIVHVHNTLNLISPSVYYAARSMETPVVQTIHNFRLLCPGATFYRDGHICEECVTKGLGCAVKHSCYRGSKIQTLACVISTKIHRWIGIYGKINYICLTEFNKEKLLDLKQVKSEKVFVKPNFTFRSSKKKADGKYYLYIGRIETIKGVDKIVEAFSKMTDKKIYLAGTGTELENLKNKYKNFDNIEFLGFVNKDGLNELLRATKAVVVDSQWYETFGMIVIEAYAAGVPVIVGDIGNVGDLVISGKTGIKFQFDSVEDMIRSVEQFESDAQNWEKSCRDIYEDKYSPNKNRIMLESIYKEIDKMKLLEKASPNYRGG